MWSSTANTTSDNKKKEEVENCRCSTALDAVSSGIGSGGVGENLEQIQQQQKQQQINIFENNSKKQLSTFSGGNLMKTDNDDSITGELPKEKLFSNAVAADSGFISGDSGCISGPLSSSNLDQEYNVDKDLQLDETAYGINTQNLNIKHIAQAPSYGTGAAAAAAFNFPKEQKLESDSGCIDDEVEVEFEDEVEAEHKVADNLNSIAKQQVNNELSNATVGSASLTNINNTSTNNDQMIFKKNVDAGMSEWFCNLSLQTETMPRSLQQQQQQPHTTSITMNNLNSGGRKSETVTSGMNTISNTHRQQQQQQQAQAAPNTAPIQTPTTITPTTAWEQFYQQNDDGDTPLHLACISGASDVVVALIRMAPHPCLFDIQNDDAQTPLHLAALAAQPKILRILLIAGANPTIRDRHGNTALHLACINGEEQCVNALTAKICASEINEGHRVFGHRSNDKMSYLKYANLPSDLEIRNYDGERCVHLAAQAGYIDILRILEYCGADINAREGKSGRTPLHIAIESCNEELANFLLDECQKLNLETATYAGLTAYQVAGILNKTQMLNILEKRGAEPLTPPESDYEGSDIETDLEDTKNYDRFGHPGFFAKYNGGSPMTVA